MADASQAALSFANTWAIQDTTAAATECVEKAAALIDKVRTEVERKSVDWKGVNYRDAAITETAKAISVLQKQNDTNSNRQALARLFGQIIGNQVLTEGNNRFAYLLVLMLSTKFKVDLPATKKIINRDKDAKDKKGQTIGFNPNRIAEQFMGMYD